jgi:hypothetical protein
MDFPNSPSVGQTYTVNGFTWTYNGYAWDKVPLGATPSTITQVLGYTPYNAGTAVVLTNNNYNTYAPSKTGTGASGNWGINVTGTAGAVDWANVTSKPDLSSYATTTQLALKAPLASPTFTGAVTVGNSITFTNSSTSGLAIQSASPAQYSYQFSSAGIRLPTTTNLSFGSGDFTIEFWINAAASQTTYAMVMDSSTNNTGTGIGLGTNVSGTAGKLSFYAQGGTSSTLNSTTTMTDNVWRHVACVKSGNNGYIFINGVLEASTASWSGVTAASMSDGNIGRSRYGSGTGGDNTFTGYLSNLRIIKGTALYTSTFTPPTTTLIPVSGTVLLTAQSNSIVDNSAYAMVLTNSGVTTTSSSAPAITSGIGSISFPSTAYLNVPVALQLSTATTPFTIELYIYPTATLNGTGFFGTDFASTGSVPFALAATSSLGGISGSNLSFGFYNGSSWAGIQSSTTLTLNTWSHVACVYTGTTATLYLNGTSIGTYTGNWTANAGNTPFHIGRRWDNGYGSSFAGNIAGFRYVSGTALYTTTFTAPTLPLSPVSGTQILLNNYTSAAVLTDSSSNNYTITGVNSPVWSTMSPGAGDAGSTWQYDGAGTWVANRNAKVVGNLTVLGNITGTVSGLSISASSVGLGNVTNESKATMFTNPTFTGGSATFTNTAVKLNDAWQVQWGTAGTTYINGTAATLGSEQVYIGIAGTVRLLVSNTGANITGALTVSGTTTLQQSTEVLNTKTGATGVVTHDYSTGAIWYHTSIAANFTANFTNVPTTDARTIVCTLILAQGATPYIPNAVQILGSVTTIKWLGTAVPTGSANKVDVVSFTLIRSGAAWAAVLGSLSSYG